MQSCRTAIPTSFPGCCGRMAPARSRSLRGCSMVPRRALTSLARQSTLPGLCALSMRWRPTRRRPPNLPTRGRHKTRTKPPRLRTLCPASRTAPRPHAQERRRSFCGCCSSCLGLLPCRTSWSRSWHGPPTCSPAKLWMRSPLRSCAALRRRGRRRTRQCSAPGRALRGICWERPGPPRPTTSRSKCRARSSSSSWQAPQERTPWCESFWELALRSLPHHSASWRASWSERPSGQRVELR
mmetsp:Transcript_30183/g.86462  ORF Transcript_30183/g.86462 Transcript_30183/m.86462 type:complete len:240 (+) Transcript_30183:1662-2381(+)